MSEIAQPSYRAEDLASDLAHDDLHGIDRLFAAAQRKSPKLIWNPLSQQLPTPDFKASLNLWVRAGGREARADVDLIASTDLDPLRAMMLIVDVDDDQVTFRYRNVGNAIANFLGHDLTGETSRSLVAAARAPGTVFYEAVYRAACQRQAPVLTFNDAAGWVSVDSWCRLTLPLWSSDGDVRRFVVLAAPVSKRDVEQSTALPPAAK
jgi:hypothetical protein